MEYRTIEIRVPDGLNIVADVFGPEDGPPVFLLHGGGQTRRSWRETGSVLAGLGYRVIAPDARGHGESDHSSSGDYTPTAFASDLNALILAAGGRPVLIGASLGGIVGLLVAGEGRADLTQGLIMVDVALKTNPYGVKRIHDFMMANPDGFASLEEAADAVAAYASDRPRPKSVSGLARNLRLVDGRYYWHWDGRFLTSWQPAHAAELPRLERAASNLRVPTLVIHAAKSDVIGMEEVNHLRRFAPAAHYVVVENAGHMVVGDKNSEFNRAILKFLNLYADPAKMRERYND